MKFRPFLAATLVLALPVAIAHAQSSTDPNEGSQFSQDPTTGAYTFSWWGRAGRTYFIQQSNDLINWTYLPVIESGYEQVIQWGFTSTAAACFVRLPYSDIPTDDPFNADFNGDGLSNWQNLLQGSDPLAPPILDTNGLPLNWEAFYNVPQGVDPNSQAPCGNGTTYLEAFQQGTNPNDYYNGAVTSMAVVEGGDQRGTAGSVLPIPLSVEVNSTADYNYPVTFSVIQGGVLLSASNVADPNNPPTASITLPTTSSLNVAGGGTVYVAQVYLFLPNTPNDVSQIKAVVQKARPDGPTVTTSASAINSTLVPPSNLTVQISADQTTALLQWTPGDTSRETTIEASLDGGIDWLTLGSVAAGVNSATITGLNPDTIASLSFRVYTASGNPPTGGTGANGAFVLPSGGSGGGTVTGTGGGTGGAGGGTGSAPSTPSDPAPPPALPTINYVWIDIPDVDAGVQDPDYSKINVQLNGSVDGATDYIVERNQDAGSWTQVADLSAGTSQYQDSGLMAGCAYRYRVSAKNSVSCSAPVYSYPYRIPLVKKVSVNPASQSYYKPGFAEFVPSTPPKYYLNQTTSGSYNYDWSTTDQYGDTFSQNNWDNWYTSKATINPLNKPTTYQGSDDYHQHGYSDWVGTPYDLIEDYHYDTQGNTESSNGVWSGSWTSSDAVTRDGNTTTTTGNGSLNGPGWSPSGGKMASPKPTEEDFDLTATNQTGSYSIVLDTEYTTDKFIQDVIAALPAFQDANWYDYYYYDYWGYDYGYYYDAWDPDIECWIGSRYLRTDETYLGINQPEYRFTLRPAVAGTMLTWLEVFVPNDDPTTPDVDESDYPTVVNYQSIAVSGGQTDPYTIDVTQPGKIDDPTQSGSYVICVPTVDLDVNDTDDLTDDYVVKQKPTDGSTYRQVPIHGDPNGPANAPGGVAGNNDNSVPLRVTFNAVYGLKANVNVTVQSAGGSGGSAVLVQQDGTPIPSGGIPLVAGVDGQDTVELLIQGTHESAALGDVSIVATADVAGSAVLGKRNITVIWVTPTFRGSAPGDQNQPWDPTSEVGTIPRHPELLSNFRRVVGEEAYNFSYTSDDGSITNQVNQTIPQVEVKGTISPNEIVPDMSWDFEQEYTVGLWGPSPTATFPPANSGNDYTKAGHGFTDWALDTVEGSVSTHGSNADLIQELGAPYLFYNDAPAIILPLDAEADSSFVDVVKFRTWLEVQIGGKWYVCSQYMPWRDIKHDVSGPGETYFSPDATKTNEILQGWLPSMSGFGNTFDPNTSD